MNEMKIFEHPKFGRIRTITEDGKTLFCGVDATNALGYKNSSKALADHCKGVTKRYIGVQTGVKSDGSPAIQQMELNFITEGDLCRLAATSELPGANEFESWIFDEVIPAILRTGTYSVIPVALNRTPEVSPGGLAKLIGITRRVMLDMGKTPVEVGAMTMSICRPGVSRFLRPSRKKFPVNCACSQKRHRCQCCLAPKRMPRQVLTTPDRASGTY